MVQMHATTVCKKGREGEKSYLDATWVFDQRERTDRMLLYKGCPVGAVKLPYFPLEKSKHIKCAFFLYSAF